MKRKISVMLAFLLACINAYGQKKIHHDLSKMLTENRLIVNPGYSATILNEGGKRGITCTGTVWLKDVNFNEGSVELDIRGRNEFLKSFVGIVFNASDTARRENICFRPFNFRHQDPVRRTWSLQYTSDPEYPYERLRSDHPGEFEHEIIPNPKPEDWLHARIVVSKDSVFVYVNKMKDPQLKAKRLAAKQGPQLGLWVFGKDTPGDFANLVIRKVN